MAKKKTSPECMADLTKEFIAKYIKECEDETKKAEYIQFVKETIKEKGERAYFPTCRHKFAEMFFPAFLEKKVKKATNLLDLLEA